LTLRRPPLIDSVVISRRRADEEWGRLISELETELLDLISSVYDLIQWPGVVVLMALETVIFLIPSEAVMTLAGWMLIKDKGLGGEWIILAGLLGGFGSTLGSIFTYYVGVWGGRPLVRRFGRYIFITESDLDAAERFFARWGTWAVFFGRMVPLVRTFVSIPAGTARMDLRLFTIYTFAGSVIWAALLAAGGYALGENWEDLRGWMGPADIIVAAVLGLLAAWYIVHHVRKAWEAQPSGPEA
jgi:membrane protein DedA with SNARE-associated domain